MTCIVRQIHLSLCLAAGAAAMKSTFQKFFAATLMAAFFALAAPALGDTPLPVTANKVEGPVTGQLQDAITLNIAYDGGIVTNTDSVAVRFCIPSVRLPRTCDTPDRKLHMGGKRQLTGIGIMPPVAGEWRWDGDYSLRFTPEKAWPAGESFRVAIDPAVFPKNVALKDTHFVIQAAALRADVGSIEFFQDFNNPELRGVSTAIHFNTPVAAESVKTHLSYRMEELGEAAKPEDRKIISTIPNLPFEVKLSEDGLTANVTSPITTMPDKERFVVVDIAEGITAASGGKPLGAPDLSKSNPERRTGRVRIPSIYDYAELEGVQATIVQDDHYVPSQTLVIESNVPKTGDELAANLHIYQLPKDKPPAVKDGTPERDYSWSSASEVTDEILKASEEVKFTLDTRDAALVHGVKFDAVPGRWLLVRVSKGMKFKGGYVLGANHDDTVVAPEYTKEVKILSDGALMSLSGERKMSLYSLGASKIRFEVGRVLNDDIAHLVSQTGGSFQSPYFRNYNFGQENISEKFTKELDLSGADLRKPQFNAFSLAPYLKMPSGEKGAQPPKGKGLFFVTIKALAKDAEGREQEVSSDKRFILVSDLGIVVKTAADGSQDVFIQSIAKGIAVGDARVEVIGTNGVAVATVRTDAQGHAVIPPLKGLIDEKRPVAYIVRQGDDMAFMPYDSSDRSLDYSKFDTDGMSASDAGLRAYLFSDRGVYRPGEQVHIGMVVKQGDWAKDLTGVPLQLEITNPRGQVIDNPVVKLQASGAAEYSFSTRDTSPTGSYAARLYITNGGRTADQLGSVNVRVEEFIPDTLKISTVFNKPAPKGWMTPDGLNAEVTLAHLYGAPAVDHRIKATLRVDPAGFSFKEYPDYAFFDAARTDASFDQSIGEAQTDADGRAVFELPLAQFGKSTYRLAFGAEGFAQDSGRSVFASGNVLVSALKYVVGVKTDGNIGYINKGEQRGIRLIAVDPQLAPVAVAGLTASVAQVTYVSTLIKNESGAYEYRSVAKETQVSQSPVDIPAAGLDYKLDSAATGNYVLTLADADGLTLHKVNYSIVGEGNMIDHARKDAVISVRLDREKYAAGDTINLSITSPYTGTGLVTIETDKVQAFKWFRTKTTSTVQSITLPKNFTGKGFVNVQFVRSLDSTEIYTTPLAYAVQPFLVDTATIDSRIGLSVPERIKPGEDLAITYSTKSPSKIIVYAVDEGILQYARYKTPDPLDFFVNRRALQVATAQILDLLMPEYSLLRAATGGDGGGPDGRSVNPFKRKTEAPVAFWSGVIDAGKTPQVLHYKVPDYFNGNLRVMAVAVSDTAMGAASTKAFVKGDVIISPNVPVFAAPGDTFRVGLSLANNLAGSGKDAKIKLVVSPSEHLEVVEGAESDVTVAENAEAKTAVMVRAKDVLGGATLTFTATLNGVTAKYDATLSIRPPLPSMTALQSGYVEKGDKTVAQDRDLYREFAHADASVSTLPVSLIPGLAQYLDRFPYGCTEQTVSRAFPAVTLYGQKDLGGDNTVVTESVVNTMRRLRELQNSRGGFGYWWYGGEANDFVSVYALDYMTRAKEKHLPVPDATFRDAQNYVRDMVNGAPASLDEARVQAYGIYILTRGGMLTANYLPHLLQYLDANYKAEWKNDLTAVYIAASYRLMQLVPEANALLSEFTLGDPVYWREHARYESNWMFYNSLNRYAQYMSVVSDHFPDMLGKLDRNILFRIANFIGEGSYNTLSSSYAIMAFSAYGQASTGAVGSNLSISQKGAQLPLTGEVVKRAELALEKSDVAFAGGGDYALFYQIATDGYDRDAAKNPIEDGLEISRTYLGKDHKPVADVALGDTVDVVIRMRAHDDKTLDSMALVDLLPGGFELVPQSIAKPVVASEDGEEEAETTAPDTSWLDGNLWQTEAVDARDDRVIAFGSVAADEVVYHYSIKAVNAGSFTVPPAYIESMYDRGVKARGVTGVITVK